MNDPIGVAAFGFKSGFFALLATAAVSILAVVVGFTVVPLQSGQELRDAGRRLAAGLLCSFTLGPLLASYGIEHWPWILTLWVKAVGGHSMLWAYIGAATPFVAVSALGGFWIVAIIMRSVQRRAAKDLSDLVHEMKGGTL